MRASRRILALFTILALIFTLVQAGGRQVARAADGDNLRVISGAYSQGSCWVNVGLAFDGTNLLVTCYENLFVDRLSPVDGSLQGFVQVDGLGMFTGLGAAAWDASRSKLWVCADFTNVLLVDLTDGSSQLMFSGYPCFDGLAYDGTDDTLWMSPDASSPVTHVKTDGTLIAQYDVWGMLGGYGNSGIAVGGGDLYLANNGGSQIYQVPKDFSTSTLFANFPARLEDLECDDITFAGQGVGAIWSIDAYDRTINAWEIPSGKCGFGGGPSTKQVQIDVKPNSDPSSFGCASQGSIPVAIIGTEELDVTQIDVNSVRFGKTGMEAAEVHRDRSGAAISHVEDFNGDGIMDLILHFSFPETGYGCADIADGEQSLDTMAKLTGLMLDGTAFEGEGDLRLVR